MNSPAHPHNCTRSRLRLSSVVFDPPTGASLAPSAQSTSLDPTAMSQDSPARIDSLATSFFDSMITSLATVPPPPPPQQGSLTLTRSAALYPPLAPRQSAQSLPGLPFPHTDAVSDAELLYRSSFEANEEEARVEELLDGPALFAGRRKESYARRIRCEMAETSSTVGLGGSSAISESTDPFGKCSGTSFAECIVALPSAVDSTTYSTEAREQALDTSSRPLIARYGTLQRSHSPATAPVTWSKSAATMSFGALESLGKTEMRPPRVLAEDGSSPTVLPAIQRPTWSTSRQSTPNTVCIAPPLQPWPPLDRRTSRRICISSRNHNAVVAAPSSRDAHGTAQHAEHMICSAFCPATGASSVSASSRSSHQAAVVAQSLRTKSFNKNASSPRMHAAHSSCRQPSPSIGSPRARMTRVAESSALQPLSSVSRPDSSGILSTFPSCNSSVALLSAEEVVPPFLHVSRVPQTERCASHSELGSARTASIARGDSPGASTSAFPSRLTSLNPMSLLAAVSAPAKATGALCGERRSTRFPLDAMCTRTTDVPVSSESKLSAEEIIDASDSMLSGTLLFSATAGRSAGALVELSSQQHLPLSVNELSASIPSQEMLTLSSAECTAPACTMLHIVSHAVRERGRRSMMQRIFREPKRGGQRMWVSITASQTCSSSTIASGKS